MSEFDKLPPFDPRGLTLEQVRALVESRVRLLKKLQAQGNVPPSHFESSPNYVPLFQGVAHEIIKQAFEKARFKLEDRVAGLPEGDANTLVNWNVLEEVLGPEALGRLRNGKDT